MLEIICVMGAGAIGALGRFGTDRLGKLLLGSAFPYGTLTVNVLGCFLFGVFMQFDAQGAAFSKYTKLLATTGFLGAFTTFSTFGFDTFQFFKSGHVGPAIINITANLILGLLAVWGGTFLVKSLGT